MIVGLPIRAVLTNPEKVNDLLACDIVSESKAQYLTSRFLSRRVVCDKGFVSEGCPSYVHALKCATDIRNQQAYDAKKARKSGEASPSIVDPCQI